MRRRILTPEQAGLSSMQHAGLKNSYVSIERGGRTSFGGSQNWFGGMLEKCGCGIISAADILWYLENKTSAERTGKVFFDQYEKYVRKLRKNFLLIPYRGMPGFLMAVCFDIYLRRRHLGYRAHWGTLPGRLQDTVREMLEDDIPVPFCVGPCLHQRFHKNNTCGLKLYEKRGAGTNTEEYVWTKTVRSHFMTMTGLDGDRVRISSWGEEYYISLKELADLVRKDGFGLFTNIISIRRIRPKKLYLHYKL